MKTASRITLALAIAGSAAPSLAHAGGTEDAKRLYTGWTFTDAAALEKAYGKPLTLVTDAKVDKKGFGTAQNPDPAWIVGWKNTDWTNAEENAALALQAAANRTWIDACGKDYAAFRAADAKIAAQFRPELDKLAKEPNWYVASKGFVELAKKVQAARIDAKLGATKDSFRIQGDVGFGFEVAAAAVAYQKGSTHNFTTTANRAFSKVFASPRLAKEGRAFSSDDAFEKDTYCAQAAERGTPTLVKLPIVVQTDQQHRGVKWPEVTKEEVQKTLRKKEETLRTEGSAKLELPNGIRIPHIQRVEGADYDKSGLKIATLDGFKVVKVTATGLEIAKEEVSHFDYACTKGKINGINSDGKFTHDMNCKEGKDSFHLKATIAVSELPPGFAFKAGDEIEFYGEIKTDVTKNGKKAVSGSDFSRTITGDLRHLTAVKRDGKSAL